MTLYKDSYPNMETYVLTTPSKYPFPWLNPSYKPISIQKGDFSRDEDRDLKIDDEE